MTDVDINEADWLCHDTLQHRCSCSKDNIFVWPRFPQPITFFYRFSFQRAEEGFFFFIKNGTREDGEKKVYPALYI